MLKQVAHIVTTGVKSVKVTGCKNVDWIQLIQDGVQWRVLANSETWGPIKK
jgi:hypothetical protein